MKKFLLSILTIFFAYYCAFITSGASEKQELFGSGNSGTVYKLFCLITGQTDTTDAYAVYSRGVNYFLEKQFELAINDMDRVLRIDSSFSAAYLTRGQSYLGAGDTSLALSDLQIFVQFDDSPVEGYLELGNIFKAREMADSSLYFYKKAFQANNAYPIVNYNISLYFYHSNNADSALKYINMAIVEDDYSPDYRNLRRLIYIKQNRLDLAQEEYNHIVSNNADFFGDYKNKAVEENKEGNFQASVEYYKLALNDLPDNRELLEGRAWVYHSLERYDSALIDFERVVQLFPDYLSYFNLAYTFDLLSKIDESILNYNKSVELKDDYYLAYNNRGYEYYQLKKYSKAEADYTKSIELKSDYYLHYYNRGILYYDTKKYAKAVEDYKNAVNYATNTKYIIYSLALAYDKLNNNEDAIYNYNEFLKQAGENDSIRINYATERVAELGK